MCPRSGRVPAAALGLAAAPTAPHHARAQERGIRSGTVPAPLAVGFGAACAIAQREMAADHAHVTALARRLYDGITSRLQARRRPPVTGPAEAGRERASCSCCQGGVHCLAHTTLKFAGCRRASGPP